MLKHMARPGPDHLRTPSNGLSDSGASDHVTRRLLTTMSNPIHSLANGYVSPGRYSQTAVPKIISQQQQQQQQQQQHQQQHHQLHVSLLNTSKHSLSPTTSVSPGTANHTKTTLSNLDQSRDDSLPLNFSSSGNGPLCSSLYIPDRSLPNGHHSILSNSGLTGNKGGVGLLANGGLNIRRGSEGGLPVPPSVNKVAAATRHVSTSIIGVREMLISLGLLCILSLLMGLLALIFLLKMSPPLDPFIFDKQVRLISPEEQMAVYEVSLALCSLSLTLDVCCCLVCAAQLLFAARLITSSSGSTTNATRDRIRKFLRDSAVTRICAIAAFFVSIPVFLTDVVLYTVLQFPSTPAITTSILISVGIVLCGCAMLHNIVVWQRHKNASSSQSQVVSMLPDLSAIRGQGNTALISNGKLMSPSQMPPATLDLSALGSKAMVNTSANLSNHNMHELSTLV